MATEIEPLHGLTEPDLTPVAGDGALPDAPTLLVDAPRGWTTDRLAELRGTVERGATVVVIEPTADWADLLGADVDAPEPAGEVVLEAGDDPLARNLPNEHVVTARIRPLRPRPGTRTLLATRLRFGRQAAVTVRDHGAGRVVGVALAPELDRSVEAPVATAVGRALRVREVPDHEVGLGIVGYGQHGGMGWLHGTAAVAVDGLRLAAIAETHDDRRADAAGRFPGAAAHTSMDALLADDAVEVVLLATPPSTHAELAERALRAGRHVVVEKPLCFTAREADRLLALAEETGQLLTVHQNRRWDADFRAVQRLVREGRLGEVFNVETFVGGFEHPCRLWHSERSVSGGRLYDWGAHLVDQTLRLLDDQPIEVTATGHDRVWHDVTNLDQVRVRMRFADGREAEFLDSDVLAARRPKYVVQGTQGTLVGRYAPVVEETVTPDHGHQRVEHHHAEAPARLTLVLHEPGWGLHEVAVPNLPAAPHAFHRRLADHLQLGDPVPVDPVEVRDVTAVLEAAHTSAHDGGRTVRPA
jgi:predicted dehydrogenase